MRLWQKQFGNDGFFTHNSYAIDVDADGNVSVSGVSVKSTRRRCDFADYR
jgi:hypothetical protein